MLAEQAALCAAQEMLEQVEDLRVALRLRVALAAQDARALPDLLVHDRREGHADPVVLGLLIHELPVLGRDVTGPAVPPRALVDLVAQEAVDGAVVPAPARLGHGHALLRQPAGDQARAHVLLDAHLIDAAHDLGLVLDDLGPAVVADAVAVGDGARGDAALLGGAALAHG